MDAVDWTGFATLGGLFLGGLAWLRNQLHREIDTVRQDIRGIDARLDRLEERYVRHLEQHVTGTAP